MASSKPAGYSGTPLSKKLGIVEGSKTIRPDAVEDTIREVALPLGLVDVKVCAVSEVWSGLKFVIRKELR